MPDIKFIRFDVEGLDAYLEMFVRDNEIILTDMDLMECFEDHIWNLAWQYAIDLNVPLKCVVIDDQFLTGADKMIQADWYSVHDPSFDLYNIVKLANAIGYDELDSKPERQKRLVGYTPHPFTEAEITKELQENPAFAAYVLWTHEELRIALYQAGYSDCDKNVDLLAHAIQLMVNPDRTLWSTAIAQSLYQLRLQLLPQHLYHQAA